MRFGRYNFFCGRIHLNVSDQIIMTLITSDCPHWQLPHIVVDRIWALPQHLCQNQANDLGIFVFRSRKCYFEPKMSYDIQNIQKCHMTYTWSCSIHEFSSAPPMERLGLRGPRDFLLCRLQHSHLLWIDHRSKPLFRWRQRRRVRFVKYSVVFSFDISAILFIHALFQIGPMKWL